MIKAALKLTRARERLARMSFDRLFTGGLYIWKISSRRGPRLQWEHQHSVKCDMIISPRSQWEEYICPCCDELMNDPVLTSCGHQMCYKCFDSRRRCYDPWCPVRDEDGQKHDMSPSWGDWRSRDKATELEINKLLVKCDKCKVECTVKEYRKFHAYSNVTQAEFTELCHFLVNDCKEDLLHWKQLLLQYGVITSSQISDVSDTEFFIKRLPTMGCKQFAIFIQVLKQCKCSSCNCLSEDLSNLYNRFYIYFNDEQQCSTASADTYTKLASMKTFRELEKLPPDQQQKLITQVLKETLPAAKHDLLIEELRPLLYQNGVITSEEATELLGVFTGEEKVTKLYTEMLPKKGLKGLKKFMDILYDTGLKWNIPSHVRHKGVLSIILSEKLLQIKSGESVLCQYNSQKAARKAIVPLVYSESLPDAVICLSMSVNKLLLPMLKKHFISTTDYCWLRGACYRGRKLEFLYKEVLPQKGVEGLKAFMEILQDVGRKIPKYQNHRDLLKSSLQAHLSKTF